MNHSKVALTLAASSLMLAACGSGVPSNVRFPGGAEVPFKTVCTYDNCGAGGTKVVHPRSNAPRLLGLAADGHLPVEQLLGNTLDPDGPGGQAPRVCRGYIIAEQYDKPLEQNTKVSLQTASTEDFKTSLKAGFKLALGGAYGTLETNVDAAVTKAVTETLNGNYEVSARAYTLKPDAFADRKQLCSGQTEHSAVVYSISVVTVAGTTQSALQNRLENAINLDATLKAAVGSADASLNQKGTSTTKLAAETAAQATSMVVSIGFDLTPG